MLKISKNLTTRNYTPMTNKRIMWIVIHYVGAVSTAFNNTEYFKTTYRGASANYFVDEHSIWQCVDDKDMAWHVGAYKYYNSCRNSNSIGIELCCKKDSNGWYFEKETVKNAQWLTRLLMDKYNIPIERVCRHYDVTHKICPEPYVKNLEAWREFIKGVTDMEEELTYTQKQEKIKEVMNIDDNTTFFLSCYKHNIPLCDKMYKVCVDAEKYRNGLK